MQRDVEMTFGEHLEELRRRILLALVGIVVGAGICGLNYKALLRALLVPYAQAYQAIEESRPPQTSAEDAEGEIPARGDGARVDKPPVPPSLPPPRVILGSPMTGYVTIILLSVICGTILASPWVIYQAWAFVAVALYPHERRQMYVFGPASFLLFLGGAAGFYFFMLRVALQALLLPTADLAIEGIPLVDSSLFLNDYFRFVAWMTLIFGLVFQTPLVVLFLARTGIVPLRTLVRQQRIVILLMCILAAVFTPPDPVTMIVMVVPLILLYEIGLLAAWILGWKDRVRQPEEPA
ncbi:MAG: twin-arginine translocase subunit TatC [Phycisphaerae bacterium]|nr:twin-arginine translocase subunit TatC [Phycisphaerae bacterium]